LLGNFKGENWQNAEDDLIKGEGFSSDLSIIEDYDGMKGVRAYVSYMFEDDRLCGISVTLSNQKQFLYRFNDY